MNEQTNNNQAEQSEKEYQNGRTGAMVFGGIVYTGVVLAATTLFINFILTAFPNNAFASRAIMTVAGLFVGCSMLAFPIALHKWAVSGWHRYITIGLYFGEMVIVALNTIVSFAALLYSHAGAPMPPWVAWYEPFSVVSIIYTLAAWGTIFLTDPAIRRHAHERAAKEKFYDKVQSKLDEFLDSVEGEEAVERVAVAKIHEKFHPDLSKKRHWGNGNLEENAILARLPQDSSVRVQRPALPMRREYTAGDLCALWEVSLNDLATILGQYGSAVEAYNYCQTNNFLPPDMSRNNFFEIYAIALPDNQIRPAPKVPQVVNRTNGQKPGF